MAWFRFRYSCCFVKPRFVLNPHALFVSLKRCSYLTCLCLWRSAFFVGLKHAHAERRLRPQPVCIDGRLAVPLRRVKHVVVHGRSRRYAMWRCCLPLACDLTRDAAGHLYGATHMTKRSGLHQLAALLSPQSVLIAAAALTACCSMSATLRPTNESNRLTSDAVETQALAAVEVQQLFESVAEQQQRLVLRRSQRRSQTVDVVVLLAEVDDQTAVAALLFGDVERRPSAVSRRAEHR